MVSATTNNTLLTYKKAKAYGCPLTLFQNSHYIFFYFVILNVLNGYEPFEERLTHPVLPKCLVRTRFVL